LPKNAQRAGQRPEEILAQDMAQDLAKKETGNKE